MLNDYWSTTENPHLEGIGNGFSNSGVSALTGLTMAQMQNQASFIPAGPAGWDFTLGTGVWGVNGYTSTGQINDGLPYFQWQYPTQVQLQASNQAIVYGQSANTAAILGATYSIAQIVSGESLATYLPDAPALAISGANKNVGTTNTIVISGTPASPYVVEFIDGAESFTPAPLTINAVTDSKVYDGTTSSSMTPTTSGLVTGDTVSSLSQSFESRNVLGTGGSTLSVDDGYAVNDGNGGNNYAVTLNTATGTISPVTLTYAANPVSINLGQTIPTFGGTETGFVGGQTEASATTGALTFSTPATGSSPSGSYPIDGSGLTANFGNYVFVQAPGNATALTIGSFPLGQPYESFAQFSAQFNANAGYNTFFTQSQFWLFDPALDGWLIPIFTPGNEPHHVYTVFIPEYGFGGKIPGGFIAFGSSFTVNGSGGSP